MHRQIITVHNAQVVCQLSPEVNLSKRLKQLSADQPIGAILQGQEVNEKLQTKFTVTAITQRHYTVLQTKIRL